MLLLTIALFSILGKTIDAQCTAAICGANGVCNSKGTCDCKTGWVGSRCTLTDPCLARPCNGQGACYQVVSIVNNVEKATYYCQCYTGFSGQNCLTAGASPCSSNPCLNSGKCVLKPNGVDYTCECVGPYTGPRCGTYIDNCKDNKCQNEAKCVALTTLNPLTNANYKCECINGIFGNFCEKEYNECESNPCKNNAVCYDLIANYYCACVGSYTGVNCETYVNPCASNPCGSNSVCTPDGNSYVCKCQDGFFGTIGNCVRDPCAAKPCKQPDSTCIPIQPGNILTIGSCTCTANTEPGYACVCKSPIPYVAASC